MVIKIFWTDTAISQLRDIFDFYNENANIKVARKTTKKIVDRTIQLEKNPNSGQTEPLLAKRKFNYRYLVEGNYKIIYWVEENHAKIASVFDCRQNPEKMKEI